jgi:hypothetical protein
MENKNQVPEVTDLYVVRPHDKVVYKIGINAIKNYSFFGEIIHFFLTSEDAEEFIKNRDEVKEKEFEFKVGTFFKFTAIHKDTITGIFEVSKIENDYILYRSIPNHESINQSDKESLLKHINQDFTKDEQKIISEYIDCCWEKGFNFTSKPYSFDTKKTIKEPKLKKGDFVVPIYNPSNKKAAKIIAIHESGAILVSHEECNQNIIYHNSEQLQLVFTEIKSQHTNDKDPIKPAYYKGKSGQDVMDVVWDFDLDFFEASCLKYLVRDGKKDNEAQVKDLKKAIENLERKIKFLENGK